MRIKAVISYDGSRFEGFQAQKHTKDTVIEKLSKSLQSVGIESQIVGSGRTDRGVHATAQVIHFDVPSFWKDFEKLKSYLNRSIHPYIHIKHLYKVDINFHARYSAKKRAYRYIITTKPLTPFESAYKLYKPTLNTSLIKKACKLFEGEHNFRYFMKSGSEVKSTIRRVYRCRLYQYQHHYIFLVEANGFLRAQVRMMVDFLLKIDQNILTLHHLKEQLKATKRYSTSLAPPNGLYLAKVVY